MTGRAPTVRATLVFALGLGAVVAFASVVLPGSHVLLGMLAAGVGVVALFNPKIALFLIVPAMALSPDLPVHGVAVRAEDLMMVPLTVGWLAHLCVAKTRRRTPFDRLLVAYILVGIAATLWGMTLGTVHLATVSKYESSPLHVLKRIEFVVLFFIVADTVESLVDVRRIVYVLLGSMIALSLYSAWQFHTNQAIALGPEGAPIHEPGLASMVTVGLALGLMRTASTPRARFVLGLIVLFGVATLPLALGRNYIAATLIILLYVGLREQRWILFAMPALAAVALLLYPEGIAHRVLTLGSAFSPDLSSLNQTSTAPTSIFYRAQAPLYYTVWALGASPLLGLGMGSVPLGFIDSEYVVQLFYTGLAGLAIFLVFGAKLLRVMRDMRRATTDPEAAGLVQGLQLVTIGYAVYSVFAASVSATHTGGPFFIVAALAGALSRQLLPQPLAATEARMERLGSRALVPVRTPVPLPVPAVANPWQRLAVLRQAPGPRRAPARSRRELWVPLGGRRGSALPPPLSERRAQS